MCWQFVSLTVCHCSVARASLPKKRSPYVRTTTSKARDPLAFSRVVQNSFVVQEYRQNAMRAVFPRRNGHFLLPDGSHRFRYVVSVNTLPRSQWRQTGLCFLHVDLDEHMSPSS